MGNMKWRRVWIEAVVIASLTLMAVVSQPGAAQAATPQVARHAPKCEKIKAGPVTWLTIDEDEYRITGEVESYPADTYYLMAAFEVDCMPPNTVLTVVWTKGSRNVFSRKFTPKPLLGKGRITEFVGVPDQSPLGEGKYGVKFLLDKEVLTQGEVVVGSENDDKPKEENVRVVGDVKNARTRTPIAGATIYVAKEGIKVDDFFENDMPEEDTLIKVTTDSKGKFVFGKSLPRTTTFAWLVIAKGYRPMGDDMSVQELAEGTNIVHFRLNPSQ
jgi:hypothetical protein